MRAFTHRTKKSLSHRPERLQSTAGSGSVQRHFAVLYYFPLAAAHARQNGGDDVQSFFAAELAYLSAFCRAEPVEGGVRLRDDGIPDLYAHNLTYFAGAPSAPQLLRACAQEMRFRRAEGMPFLNLTVEGRAPALPCAAMRTVYDYFVLREEIRAPRPDLAVLPLTPALCAQALAFDLDVNGRDYGRDFIRRRFVRRREVYLSGRVQHLAGATTLGAW